MTWGKSIRTAPARKVESNCRGVLRRLNGRELAAWTNRNGVFHHRHIVQKLLDCYSQALAQAAEMLKP
jgi:hypothetical protein